MTLAMWAVLRDCGVLSAPRTTSLIIQMHDFDFIMKTYAWNMRSLTDLTVVKD